MRLKMKYYTLTKVFFFPLKIAVKLLYHNLQMNDYKKKSVFSCHLPCHVLQGKKFEFHTEKHIVAFETVASTFSRCVKFQALITVLYVLFSGAAK